MNRKIVVTGSNAWDDRKLMSAMLQRIYGELGKDKSLVLAHGGTSAADFMAESIWTRAGLFAYPHNGGWKEGWHVDPKLAPRLGFYLQNLKPELVVVFRRGDSGGATKVIELAERSGIEVRVVDA